MGSFHSLTQQHQEQVQLAQHALLSPKQNTCTVLSEMILLMKPQTHPNKHLIQA